MGRKAIAQLRATVKDLLTRTLSPEQAEGLGDKLATGGWTHDYPITVEEAQRLGLKVRTDIPREILRLMHLYPQPVRRQPSVEYLPIARRAERRGSDSAAE